MKRLILLSLLSCGPWAQARVGETIAECEARYGPVVERRPAVQGESDPEACLFSKAGITIVAEFKDGKAWRLLYRMPGMNDEVVKTLLEREGGNSEWSVPLKIVGQEIRSSSDHERIAVLTPAKHGGEMTTILFASKECAMANRSEYVGKLATIGEEVKKRILSKPLKDL
jgi:hypothetical protein